MTTLQNILFYAHSGVRWLVVLATVVALVAVIIGLAQKRPYEAFARRFMLIFSSLVGVQWALGILVMLVLGVPEGTTYRWEHAVIMTLALVAAHMYLPAKRQPDSRRYVISIVVILVTLVLVFVGVARLPGQSLLG